MSSVDTKEEESLSGQSYPSDFDQVIEFSFRKHPRWDAWLLDFITDTTHFLRSYYKTNFKCYNLPQASAKSY